MSVQIDGLEVVGVFRKCIVCGERKLLEHVLRHSTRAPDEVISSG